MSWTYYWPGHPDELGREGCSRKRVVRKFFWFFHPLHLSQWSREPWKGAYIYPRGSAYKWYTKKITNIQDYQLTFSRYWFYQAVECHNWEKNCSSLQNWTIFNFLFLNTPHHQLCWISHRVYIKCSVSNCDLKLLDNPPVWVLWGGSRLPNLCWLSFWEQEAQARRQLKSQSSQYKVNLFIMTLKNPRYTNKALWYWVKLNTVEDCQALHVTLQTVEAWCPQG